MPFPFAFELGFYNIVYSPQSPNADITPLYFTSEFEIYIKNNSIFAIISETEDRILYLLTEKEYFQKIKYYDLVEFFINDFINKIEIQEKEYMIYIPDFNRLINQFSEKKSTIISVYSKYGQEILTTTPNLYLQYKMEPR
jgi:hypothetical protein